MFDSLNKITRFIFWGYMTMKDCDLRIHDLLEEPIHRIVNVLGIPIHYDFQNPEVRKVIGSDVISKKHVTLVDSYNNNLELKFIDRYNDFLKLYLTFGSINGSIVDRLNILFESCVTMYLCKSIENGEYYTEIPFCVDIFLMEEKTRECISSIKITDGYRDNSTDKMKIFHPNERYAIFVENNSLEESFGMINIPNMYYSVSNDYKITNVKFHTFLVRKKEWFKRKFELGYVNFYGFVVDDEAKMEYWLKFDDEG